MKITYVTVESGDWEGLYIDGELAEDVEQNHRMSMDSVLAAIAKATGAKYEHFCANDEWMETQGWLPETVDEIPDFARMNY